MASDPLDNGVDQLQLQQEIEADQWPEHLWKQSSLRSLFFSQAIPFSYHPEGACNIKLCFPSVDLRVRKEWGRIKCMAYLKAQPLIMTPRETWDQAQSIYQILAKACKTHPNPFIKSLDLFIDIQGMRLSASLVKRLHSTTGLNCGSSIGIGSESVMYGKPKRFLLYNKLDEIVAHPTKAFIKERWIENGWDEVTPVVRMDMRFHTGDLRRLGDPIVLDKLAQDGLRRLVLQRKVRRRSETRVDPLWRKLRSLKFQAPWKVAPSPVPKKPHDLQRQATDATSMLRGQMSKMIALELAHPGILGRWAMSFLAGVAEQPDLLSDEFLDDVWLKAAKLGGKMERGRDGLDSEGLRKMLECHVRATLRDDSSSLPQYGCSLFDEDES